MANMIDAQSRNLQMFVESKLMGLVTWSDVQLLVPVDGDGDVVEACFRVHGIEHVVRIESSDYNPRNQLGRVLLDAREMGPIDVTSFDKIAEHLRTYKPKNREVA